jgi:hypothetical protein
VRRGLLCLLLLAGVLALAGCASSTDSSSNDRGGTPTPTGSSDCLPPDPVMGGPPDCVPDYDDPMIDEAPEPEGLPPDMQAKVDEMCNDDPTICDPSLDSGYSGPDGP